ncbi:MAG: Na-translocating system protein MpsB [Verrucomicrobiae bacterium]|nr:Na-translocating system protein MpsB [Verrucomicrobiae bacterium]
MRGIIIVIDDAGMLGVIEGNGGDIKTGLPLQSLHDGKNWMHEPLRLHVCIQAPKEAIERILKKHPSVANLVSNRWIHLFAANQDFQTFKKIVL